MQKDPAFLFYSSDFLNGITDLTMEERGQYITLLCLQHQKGLLSEKTIRLTVGNVSVDVLSKFSKDEEGNFYNNRLRLEMQKRENFTESRRKNGLLGGRRKKNNEPSGEASGLPNGIASENLTVNENENENIIDNKDDVIVITKPKKDSDSSKPPKEEFMKYVEERCATVGVKYSEYKQNASVRYDAWAANGWKDLNGNKISAWKGKVVSNLQYWKSQSAKPSQSGTVDLTKEFNYENLQ